LALIGTSNCDQIQTVKKGTQMPTGKTSTSTAAHVARLGENREFADQAALLAVLRHAEKRLKRRIERDQAEIYFAASPGAGAHSAKMARRVDIDEPAPVADPTSATSSVIRAGLAIARGDATEIPKRPERDLEEAREKLDVVSKAVAAQHEIVETIRGRLSFEAAAAKKPEHSAAVIAVFRAAEALAEAAAAERAVRLSLLEAGFVARDDVLRPPACAAVLMLGSAGDVNSQLEQFRRGLTDRGVL
jgi:hypothetical protein